MPEDQKQHSQEAGNNNQAPATPRTNIDPGGSPQAAPPLKPKKSKLKWAAIAGVLLIIVSSVAAALMLRSRSADDKSQQPATLTKVSVRLAWLHQAQFAGMYVAQEKGYYRDAGLDVDLKEYEDGVDPNQELIDSKVDFAVTSPLELFLSADKGNKTKAVAAIYQTSPYAFVSPKSSNIKSPTDFKGKVLGNIGNNTQATATYKALMSTYGVKESDVTIKTIDFDVVKDFKEKAADTADIYRTDQTYLLDQEKIEYNLLLPEQFDLELYGDVLATTAKLIQENPDLVRRFTQATLKGWQYALDNQPEAVDITTKAANELYKDRAYEAHILSTSAPLITPTGNLALGDIQYIPWSKSYQIAKAAGLLKNELNINETYTTEFLD